ncbi:winged helix-turn-helix domain-containing protein [uncultured Pluralibacter sp.]|uniref:winged helix-turn-helix domain-containing protein n=1 Tax=uncultured Pluralibacter sp. TaxID=1490864 RepID=UPI0026186C82|nr:winged helix-turn-helix domain-containing protein [uncultured Pluralibacter sp.]
MRILIFDKNQASSCFAPLLMSRLGIVTDTFSDIDNALRSLKRFHPDVFIISTHQLCEQHCALISRYRKKGIVTPVIVTATESTKDLRITAYEAGADDIVSGEIEAEEFVARVSAIERRSRGIASNRIQLPPYELDLSGRQLLRDGTEVELTNYEYMVAELLMKRTGKVVTRDEMMRQLYSDADLQNQDVINVLICRLKKKLCRDSGLRIKTIRGLGYVFQQQ